MNTLQSFVTTIPATLKSSDVIDRLDVNSAFLKEVLIEHLERFATVHPDNRGFKSKEAKAMIEQFHRLTAQPNRAITKDLLDGCNKLSELSAKISNKIGKVLPRVITKETLTYRQLGYMQFSAAVDFMVDYTAKFINHLLRLETCELSGDKITNHTTPAALAEISDGWILYCQVYKVLCKANSTFLTDLDNTVDLVVEEGTVEVVMNVQGALRTNPMVHGFIPPKYNLFRIVGMAIADWQAKRYHQLQEQLNLFQVLLAYQKQLLEKEVDPSVERRIEELNGVIEELQAKIRKMEKLYD